jgi:hypothetical protein
MTNNTASTVVPTRGQGATILALIEASLEAGQRVPFDDAGADLGFAVLADTRGKLDRIIPLLQEARRVLALAAERELSWADNYYRVHEARLVHL